MAIELDVRCDTCGGELSATVESNHRRSPFVSVTPCVICLDKARVEGREEVERDA